MGTITVGKALGNGPALFGQPFEDQGVYVVLSDKNAGGSLSPEVITGGKLDIAVESPLEKLIKLAGLQP